MPLTRSASDPLYHELERYVTEYLIRGAPDRELTLVRRADSADTLDAIVVAGTHEHQELTASIRRLFSSFVLPTVYDDVISFSVADALLKDVRKASTKVVPTLSHEMFGGFCCAPTSSVNAQAVPIATAEGIRVFVVFESGLFTFVHGLLSTPVAAAPPQVWQAPRDWLAGWEDYQVRHSADITEAAGDLAAWIGFFARHNERKGLTFVSLASLGRGQQRLLHDMVRGCELFLTAHEYVHAIAGHHDPQRDAREVEAEADRSGARIAAETFRENGVNPTHALCGIALVLSAIGQHQQHGPHAHFEARLSVIEDEVLPHSADQKQARESITAWTGLLRKFVGLADQAGMEQRNAEGL